MPRAPLVPAQLTTTPFTTKLAQVHGVTKDMLRGASWKRIDRGVYALREIADGRLMRLRAVLHRLPNGGGFSGPTAGWLRRLDLEPCDPIEIMVPNGCNVTRRAGIRVRRSDHIELSTVKGLPATSALQTVVDLARRPPLVEAVVILDMALHRRLVTAGQLERWAANNPRRRGVALLRRALELAEPATESPMETRLRLLLVLAGLPRPQVQPKIRDESGLIIARPDLCYPVHRLAIEYDGATHKDSVVGDNRRHNRLFEAGYQLLRFTAPDVLGNPSRVISLVRRAIARPLAG